MLKLVPSLSSLVNDLVMELVLKMGQLLLLDNLLLPSDMEILVNLAAFEECLLANDVARVSVYQPANDLETHVYQVTKHYSQQYGKVEDWT